MVGQDESLIDLIKSLIDLIKPLIDLVKPPVDLNKSLIDLSKSLIDLVKPLIDLSKPLIDLIKPPVNFGELLAQELDKLLVLAGSHRKAPSAQSYPRTHGSFKCIENWTRLGWRKFLFGGKLKASVRTKSRKVRP